ncbi:secreted phosphoprotein 24 [Echeneis naucrates]|uniref:secreted phosphoprotein 24 n=1 Tax=Echeneis naucrates TaxID=173247 RepID=UPI0011143962|nr:secreted phosphoprotein 24 [Echeneis naucrates]
MKSYILLLAVLQVLRCSGAPNFNSELESMSNKGLDAALAEANSMYAVSRLYRVIQASVTRLIPVGLNTVDMMMSFAMKETECAKTSRTDPQTCAFRPGFFVPSLSCSSRVRVTATSAQVLAVRCGRDSSSSSSESSEEIFSRGRQRFSIPLATRVPAPSAASQPEASHSGRSLHSLTGDDKPRGDIFNNFLV